MTGSPNGMKAFWWVMGVIAMLLSAGVIAGIATYASVQSVNLNVTLLREQVARDDARQEGRIQNLERKLDDFIASAGSTP